LAADLTEKLASQQMPADLRLTCDAMRWVGAQLPTSMSPRPVDASVLQLGV